MIYPLMLICAAFIIFVVAEEKHYDGLATIALLTASAAFTWSLLLILHMAFF